ncbi:MAG: hypothetical protein DMG06_27130 [Acidobacteria bacterium]|nr:MAG: hypothetical protein DMG06_27130 [Acidobacteriota bacterium]
MAFWVKDSESTGQLGTSDVTPASRPNWSSCSYQSSLAKRDCQEVASNLIRPRVGTPEAADPSLGLRPPGERAEEAGVRGRQANKLDQSLNFVAAQ